MVENTLKKKNQQKFAKLTNDVSFSNIVLSSDQSFVFKEVIQWLKIQPSSHRTVGGYAGTGKTTLVALLRKKIQAADKKVSVGFASFTGKAAENLRKKLVISKAIYNGDSCGTIHRLMYTPETDGSGEVINWNKIDKIDKDLIIIDEASMVTEEIWHDLLSYKIPILAFGDHGQLPPIGDDFNLMEDPDLTLEKIHRQSHDNPIISLATQARLGEKIEVKNYSSNVRKLSARSGEAEDFSRSFFEKYDENSLVLVGMNHTRIRLNQAIRQAKNIESVQPIEGDKVVCLKNIYDNDSGEIFNGMIGEILSVHPDGEHWYMVEIDFQLEGKIYQGRISKYQFNNPKPIQKVKGVKPEDIGNLFDFGYALTVHKAQGSEAKKVLVVDESYVFSKRDPIYGRKWLYTAITRAEEELCVLGY
jgi:exodeoxyribonuclease V